MVDRTHGETKLWESFIKGETAAFEEVYRRYYSLLYSYGIRMVGDRELVADTIQNLFVKLILNCRNLHYTDNVKAYLLCSFRNKLLDAFQSLRPMEVIEECHEFFPMGEEIINSLFKKYTILMSRHMSLPPSPTVPEAFSFLSIIALPFVPT